MRDFTVQLFTRGLPWVALLVVSAFGLRQLQLRKSAQAVSGVPLSATVPRGDATPPTPVSTEAPPATVAADALPEPLQGWLEATAGVEARPPVVTGTSAYSGAHLRTTIEGERTQALLATARATARAHEEARTALATQLETASAVPAERVVSDPERVRVSPDPERARVVPDLERLRWAIRLEDMQSGDDVRRIAALRAVHEAPARKAADPITDLVSQDEGLRAPAAELVAAMSVGADSNRLLHALLSRLPAAEQAAAIRRIGLARFTAAGDFTDAFFRKDAGLAAETIAALAIEQQADLDQAARAGLRAAAVAGLREGGPRGIAAGARVLALHAGHLDDAELVALQGAFARLDTNAPSQVAYAALLTALTHKLTPTQRVRDAAALRRRALAAMASEALAVRAAGHRLAVSLSAQALLFDPAASLASRRARLEAIEAAWR